MTLPEQEPVSEVKEAAPKSTGSVAGRGKIVRNIILGFIGFLVVVAIAALGFGAYKAYAKGSTDKYTVAVASFLHIPVAKVNGHTISYADYADDLKAITVMRDYDKANNGPAANLTAEQLSDQVLFRQVNTVLVNDLATKYNVTADQSDIDKVKNDVLIQEFTTMDKAEQAIRDRYGWSLQTFEEKVIKPFVLQNKLGDKIKADTAAKDEIKKKAQSVLDQIKGGADFAAMAKQYGQDGTASSGGELGWFGKGEMVPEFENAAFSLKKGELDQNLVESQFGYHIIQVEDKKTDKVKDAKGKLVNKDLVKARHILFMFPTLEEELNSDVKKANIKIYPKIHNPFATLFASSTAGNNQ